MPTEVGGTQEDCPLKHKGKIVVRVQEATTRKAIGGVSIAVPKTSATGATDGTTGVAEFLEVVPGDYVVNLDVASLTDRYTLRGPATQAATVPYDDEALCLFSVDAHGVLDVTVTREDNGAAVGGVDVQAVGNGKTVTAKSAAETGIAHFANLEPGDYTVSATLAGELAEDYTALPADPGTAPVPSDGTASSTLKVRLARWVAFKAILDETKEPVKGLKIKVKLPDGRVETVTTGDEDGLARIEKLSKGKCIIQEISDSKQRYELVKVTKS